MSTYILDSKPTAESADISMDFLSRLQEGETLQTCAASISVLSGTDPNPSTMLSGSATISGTEVMQQVVGGIAGTVYTLSFSVRTSENNIYVNEAALVVTPSNAIAPP